MEKKYRSGESIYVREYKNVFDNELCDTLVSTYERLWKEQSELLKKLSLCYTPSGVKTCGACDCQRLDIMQHKEFKEPFKLVIKGIQNTLTQYKEDVDMHHSQWPKKYSFENLRIKRYLCDTNQQHDFHSDVGDKDSARRFFSIICYLNDEFDGGHTLFPMFDQEFKPSKGTILLFPCTWSYLHKGSECTNGYAKYILGTFLNYVTGLETSRSGDHVLGSPK
tara:strand:+ start:62 stop:727 length:666 start_codon:yes stop_codon:yes gene_type:complete